MFDIFNNQKNIIQKDAFVKIHLCSYAAKIDEHYSDKKENNNKFLKSY